MNTKIIFFFEKLINISKNNNLELKIFHIYVNILSKTLKICKKLAFFTVLCAALCGELKNYDVCMILEQYRCKNHKKWLISIYCLDLKTLSLCAMATLYILFPLLLCY